MNFSCLLFRFQFSWSVLGLLIFLIDFEIEYVLVLILNFLSLQYKMFYHLNYEHGGV